uniref:Uncharacterized protein n=1 Tax=Glossina brevipalpis TaxID=37001 RepID=A0A1A9WWY4_9MUSC
MKSIYHHQFRPEVDERRELVKAYECNHDDDDDDDDDDDNNDDDDDDNDDDDDSNKGILHASFRLLKTDRHRLKESTKRRRQPTKIRLNMNMIFLFVRYIFSITITTTTTTTTTTTRANQLWDDLIDFLNLWSKMQSQNFEILSTCAMK